MPRINMDDTKYYQESTGEWFTLKNDMEIARIQFLLNAIEDIPVFACHKVQVGGKDRYVDCLRQPGDDITVCPFCSAGLPTQVVRFILMFDHADGKVKIWERGSTFISKLEGLMNRYSPLSNKVFEIERHGKPGAQDTKYEVFPMDNIDPYDVTDVELPELFGTLIIDASFDDQNVWLATGNFPAQPGQAQQPQVPQMTRRVPAQAPVQAPRAAVQSRATAPAPAPQPRVAPQPRQAAPAPAPTQTVTSRRLAPRGETEKF